MRHLKIDAKVTCAHCGTTVDVNMDMLERFNNPFSGTSLAMAAKGGGWMSVMDDFPLCPDCLRKWDELLARQVDEHREFVHGDKDDPNWKTRTAVIQARS